MRRNDHSRWESLTPYDVQVLYDNRFWLAYGGNGSYSEDVMENPGNGWFQQEIPAPEDTREITPSEKECLEKLLLLREEYVNEDTVRLLDMNRLWKEMDFGYGDLYNDGHVKRIGADKVTACLLEYLRENYADVW